MRETLGDFLGIVAMRQGDASVTRMGKSGEQEDAHGPSSTALLLSFLW